MSCDVVQRFFELLAEIQPSLSEESAMQIEKQIRHEFGGEEVYIAKTPDVIRKSKERAIQEVRNGARPAEAADRNGISRRTIYRLMEKSRL